MTQYKEAAKVANAAMAAVIAAAKAGAKVADLCASGDAVINKCVGGEATRGAGGRRRWRQQEDGPDPACAPPCPVRREVAGIFKGKTMEKGVAFPTCVSVNRCAAWQRWCRAGRGRGSHRQPGHAE